MADMTRDDLITILSFGVHLAKVDNDFVAWEKKALAAYAKAMNLTEEERLQMLSREVSLGRGLKQLSGQPAKVLLIKTLCAVSHADGETKSEEMEFIEEVIGAVDAVTFILPRHEWGTYEQEVIDAFREVGEESAS